MHKSSISPCGEIVKKHDYDRFLISMLAPADVRDDLLALFAFNHEIAKTREVVSEMTLGLIRLQWWRDAINGIYDGKILSHEVVEPLARAINRHNLLREHFETLIYAREFDLEDVLPGNLEGLMNYADFTTTPLLKLAVQITGGDADMEAVQPIAINYALMGVLRAVPVMAQNGRCLLPEDLLASAQIKRSEIGKPDKNVSLSEVAQKIATAFTKGCAPHNNVLKSTQALASIYLHHLEKSRFDTMSQKMQAGPQMKVLRLVLATTFM